MAKHKPKTNIHYIRRILAKTDAPSDFNPNLMLAHRRSRLPDYCITWQGATRHQRPVVKDPKTRLVTTVNKRLTRLANMPPAPRRTFNICGNPLCINPKHIVDWDKLER